MLSPAHKVIILTLGMIIGGMLMSVPYLNALDSLDKKSEVKINDQFIIANVASTVTERERGLAGRTDLNVNEGLLFVFEEAGAYPFWMKGMKIPIDLVWILSDRIIGIEENIQPPFADDPALLKIYYPPLPANKVLEIKAGRARLLRAKLGDKVLVRPLFLSSGKF